MAYNLEGQRMKDAKTLIGVVQRSVHLEKIMRGPSPLSAGERELIAAYVSKMNGSRFCFQSHAACASKLMDSAIVHAVLNEDDDSLLSEKMRLLLAVAENVRTLDRHVIYIGIEEAIARAKKFGASEEEIENTVLIASFFCMLNRYVDSLGATFKPGEAVTMGESLARYGYHMSFHKLIMEVFPKLLKSWRMRKVDTALSATGGVI